MLAAKTFLSYEVRRLLNKSSTTTLLSTRSISSPPPSPSPPPPQQPNFPLSNRKQFNSITPNATILKHIKSIGVGIPSHKTLKSSSRRDPANTSPSPTSNTANRAGNYASTRQQFIDPPPPPFAPTSRKPVRIVASVGLAKDEPTTADKDDSSSIPSPSSASPSPTIASNASNASNASKPRRIKKKIWDDFPSPNLSFPELALIGRSNVGKSTLVNALLYGNQSVKSLENSDSALSLSPREANHNKNKVPDRLKMPKGVKAIMSDRPGETKKLTFYKLGSTLTSTGLTLVDMPGYGFAYGSKNVNGEDNGFDTLAINYLTDPNRSDCLKRLLLLLDARHGFKKADLDFLKAIENKVMDSKKHAKQNNLTTGILRMPPIQLILTKSDLVSQEDLARRVQKCKLELSTALNREYGTLPIMMVSALPGIGFNNVKGGGGGAKYGAKGGVLQMQRELAGLVPVEKKEGRRRENL